MMRKAPLPGKGCFKVAYPNTTWKKITCTTAPDIPMTSFRHRHISMVQGRMEGPQTVGDNTDFEAEVTSGLISSATGAFYNASGITSESGYVGGVPPSEPDSLSLQLNSNFYNDPPVCSYAANPSICQGWVQFIVAEGNGNAGLFMQSWLLNFGTTCLSGWTSDGYGNCFQNSSQTSLPSIPASQIPNLGVDGESENNTDTALFTSINPNEIYAVTQNDSMMDLEQNWTSAEFNVFGDGGGGEANFNSDSALIPEIELDTTDDSLECVGPNLSYATAEASNLTLVPQSAPVCCPSGGMIQFGESNISGVGASCNSGQLEMSGNFTASPTSIDGSERVITHPIIEGEIRTQYSATLEDSTPGAIITYALYDSCGDELATAKGSSGILVYYLNIETVTNSCTARVHGVMTATTPGYLQSILSNIEF